MSLVVGLLLLLARISLSYGAQIETSNCSNANTVLQDVVVEAVPYPIKAGENATISLRGNLTKEVSNGTYEVRATGRILFVNVEVLRLTGNICQAAGIFKCNSTSSGETFNNCPFPKGPFSCEANVIVPTAAPSGTYHATISATTTDDNSIFCESADVKIE
mmetsp:Transcript_25758/g.44354  ORF Transcript_25758/g.44354 Transcript_25758/m.44354 type:complete len:161 (-) Transcript_25758:77-559(-)|eukprot:CAMPEP_0196654244 /NCGR_PEP_ID=MMETSP1086-20130531/3939_1 /TAXON_ID=77921 /ORGANISM="Cyanoptyche  gloeocystis , Strain SAG4.97" /LENGTH=160 /DNA_ID=CAMNT_0041985887 /DNA_START=151 /DNA_END=633 /DNA_ORIENTATION=+